MRSGDSSPAPPASVGATYRFIATRGGEYKCFRISGVLDAMIALRVLRAEGWQVDPA